MRILFSLFLAALVSACATPQTADRSLRPVEVGVIAINDFHGALEPPKQSVPTVAPGAPSKPLLSQERLLDPTINVVQVPSGGAAWLASAVDSLRGKYTNSVMVSAGDMIGASQLASSLFLDEPAVGVMNRIGLEFNAVGNHEFDRGAEELQRLVKGGCKQLSLRKPCQIEQWAGAKFPFLAANSIKPDGSTLFASTGLKSFGTGKRKVTLGFIGITLKETSDLTSKENLQGVTFADEADSVNALVPGLKAQGADAVILLIHQGGRTNPEPPNPFTCNDLTGAIRPILDRLSDQVDVVVSGHTHWAYVCDYGQYNPAKPFLLTSAGVFGELVTDITLTIDPATDRVLAKTARNIIVQSPAYETRLGLIENKPDFPQFEPRADVAEYVARYTAAAKDYVARPVGKLGGPVFRPGGDASNKGGTLGNLIADAQLAATTGAGAQIAFMNVFGIRAPHQIVPGDDSAVTFGQLYSVQPFANTLVTQTLTGKELKAMLEQGFDAVQPIQFLSPSRGFHYSVDMTRAEGDRVVAMSLNGVPIDPAKDYRITTNSFLANGGDSFSVLIRQRDAVQGGSDIDALEAWLKALPPRPVPAEERVTDLNPGATPKKPEPMPSM
ncbi:MAG: bifunctional metallophosphatase/5'-nucleotidase [Novosphingobium sp.]|nr:bifunctional metallophosphatase/5'-nucleotidase [Novosphingobium sp.]